MRISSVTYKVSMMLAVMLVTSSAYAQNVLLAPVNAPPPAATTTIDPSLPPLFQVGNKLQFTWYQGNQVTRGTMQIDEVRGGWVRMHYIGAVAGGWIYPASMAAVWDYR